MTQRYQALIEKHEGKIHRLEDWGRRFLAYPINNKIAKAHYVLMNIEGSADLIDVLEQNFRFNDAIIRFLCTRSDESDAQTPSPIMLALAKTSKPTQQQRSVASKEAK
eukprot:NODE_3365_length_379_cov_119.133333_g2702_i0.p1 GENE.NODE_3365_length_379_cov_119.133333_g2702_i0~~NODE_3365_length_379_cov_119.133333_g2702_i0.p1  ORF type:complete len:108 (+),score=3.63 NODE_3365_length_379_cov_119.133333_g2702_i0:3-326(+)